MRHTITRTIIGIIWLAAAAVSLFTVNYLMAGVGLVAGLVYLYSAYSMKNKGKDNK